MIGSSSFTVISLPSQRELPDEVQKWIARCRTKQGISSFHLGDKTWQLISLGPRPNPGHRVEVVKVEEGEKKATVFIREIFPTPGAMYPQVIAYPYVVAKTGEEIEVKLITENNEVVPFSSPTSCS